VKARKVKLAQNAEHALLKVRHMKQSTLAAALSTFTMVSAAGMLAACSPPVTTASPPVSPAAPTTTVYVKPAAASSKPAENDALPERLSDADFWKLASDISEPGGYFQIENNYTSNEMEVGHLFTALRTAGVNGDVYLGVGPEQNFTYIAAIRPKMAFIVDIRRQAAMQHLMFKAMFEMAADRADFISLLFSKPRPAGLDTTTSIQKIWDAYRPVPTDSNLGNRTYARMIDRLTKVHGFNFTADESEKIKAVYDAFYYYGPSIATRGTNNGRGSMGDFTDLTGYSTDAGGQPRSFLSSEENYRTVKSLHERNLIVPITGDFGGPKAIRAIGAYLTSKHALVRAFYVSNVEQYLFQDGHAGLFYANVATLPVDSASVFIRPYSMRRGGGSTIQSLCPIAAQIGAATAGRVTSNNIALACAP
jgi:hypothetical protein